MDGLNTPASGPGENRLRKGPKQRRPGEKLVKGPWYHCGPFFRPPIFVSWTQAWPAGVKAIERSWTERPISCLNINQSAIPTAQLEIGICRALSERPPLWYSMYKGVAAVCGYCFNLDCVFGLVITKSEQGHDHMSTWSIGDQPLDDLRINRGHRKLEFRLIPFVKLSLYSISSTEDIATSYKSQQALAGMYRTWDYMMCQVILLPRFI